MSIHFAFWRTNTELPDLTETNESSIRNVDCPSQMSFSVGRRLIVGVRQMSSLVASCLDSCRVCGASIEIRNCRSPADTELQIQVSVPTYRYRDVVSTASSKASKAHSYGVPASFGVHS